MGSSHEGPIVGREEITTGAYEPVAESALSVTSQTVLSARSGSPGDDAAMDRLIVLCAQLLPLVPPVVAVVLWLRLPRPAKVDLGLRTLLAVSLTAVLVLIAGFLHQDPRPFVVDPAHPALFPHAVDDGFPSDHTAYAATVALLIVGLRRRIGWTLLAFALVGGLARVAANVHHLQDIVGGLVVAALAVAATAAVFSTVQGRRQGRTIEDADAGSNARS